MTRLFTIWLHWEGGIGCHLIGCQVLEFNEWVSLSKGKWDSICYCLAFTCLIFAAALIFICNSVSPSLTLSPWEVPTSPIKQWDQGPNRASQSISMANVIFFSVGHVQSVCQSNLSASQNFGGDTGKKNESRSHSFFFCLIRTWKHVDWGNSSRHLVFRNRYQSESEIKKNKWKETSRTEIERDWTDLILVLELLYSSSSILEPINYLFIFVIKEVLNIYICESVDQECNE